MLLRITLDPPFQGNTADRVFRVALEDAMLTLAEALVLGASRALDIDPSEFNAAHRFWHHTEDGRVRFDVYIFDTLAGGAGYAEEAGRDLDRVLEETSRILIDCTCTSSCQDCLRHYGNRIHHERLDRFLAAQLLDFARTGRSPTTQDLDLQGTKLRLHPPGQPAGQRDLHLASEVNRNDACSLGRDGRRLGSRPDRQRCL